MDPGWKPAFKHIWRVFVPGFFGRGSPAPTLTVVRGFWLAMPLQWMLFGSVLAFLQPESTTRPAWVYPFVVGTGAISLLYGSWVVRRKMRLKTESIESTAASFAQLSLVSWSMTTTPVLCGFVGFFLGGGMGAYLLGLPFGAVGFMLQAPTERNIRKAQEQIRSTGSPISLYEALRLPFRPVSRRQRKERPRRAPEPPSGSAPG